MLSMPGIKKESVQAIVARLRLASEFARQTRDKKLRHHFRSGFVSSHFFFHAFLISMRFPVFLEAGLTSE